MSNYTEQALQDIFESHTEYDELVLEQMEAEAEFIMSCLENNIILEAEAGIIAKGKGKLDALVTKVKTFFKRVVNDFKLKCADMYTKQAEEWLKGDGKLLEQINFEGLTIEMIPFWNVSLTDITSILDKLVGAIDNIPSEAQLKEIKSISDVEAMSPFKDYIKDKQKFSKSIKDYFRTAKGELKPVKLSDDELKQKCITVFKPYIENFNKDVVTMIQNRRTKLDAAMDKVKNTANNTGVGEAFSVLENCTFAETDLRYCSNYQMLIEAEGDNKPEPQQQEKKNDDKPNTREVVLTDENNPKDKDGKPIENKSSSNAETDYIRYAISLNQIALSAAMDILTEKFYVYLKPLKAVVSARKDTVKTEEK